MCGIAGLTGFGPGAGREMQAMLERMIHRGPDAGGQWFSEDGELCLGHRRLSIMDLSESGSQPMVSRSGKTVIVYNGEIYNHRELAERLLREKKVMAFRSTCDTEILLEGIEAYGVEETLKLCKGMFAFCVYDTQTKELVLARDRIGEKPLYYGFLEHEGKKDFAFASDIGCLRVLKGFHQPVNTRVLDIYFTHGYIPAPHTIYEGVYKLTPGCVMRLPWPYREEDLDIRPYWSLEEAAKKGMANPFRGSRQEAADELERLLRASIRGQMVADVPLGAFLSAGIDSSTIVALMQQESSIPVRSFTIGMEEKEFDEAVIAKQIAKHLGTEHTELYITEADARAVVPLLPKLFAEPFADSSQIPTYLVSKMTREHVTVSLSGDAGDELFCGYTSYASVERIWGKIKRVPPLPRHLASALVLHSPLARKEVYRIKGKLLRADSPEEIYRLSFETDPLSARIARDHRKLPYAYDPIGKDRFGEVNRDVMMMDLSMYHPDDILVKVDRTAMGVSLETRIPMLDKDVVEYSFSLPIDYLRGDGRGKLVLRDVLYRYVPKDLMERPKKGFSIPIDQWLKSGELRDWAENLVKREKIEQEGLLDPDVVRQMWEDFTERGIWRIQIWYVLMLEAWLEEEAARA